MFEGARSGKRTTTATTSVGVDAATPSDADVPADGQPAAHEHAAYVAETERRDEARAATDSAETEQRDEARAATDAADREPSARRVLLDRVAAMSDDELAVESSQIAAAVSAAQAELAVVLREIERRDLHRDWECPSIERFAGWKCQLAPARAAALGELGRAIELLPVLGDAVVDGALAIDKAVPIARVASPASVDALVDLARHATVDQTQRFCGKWRRVGGETAAIAAITEDPAADPRLDDSEAAARVLDHAALGRVIVIHDDDGLELRARFDHVHGALVLTALDAATAQVRAERRAAVPPGTVAERTVAVSGARPAGVDDVPLERLDREQWRAQGLLRMCDVASSTAPTTIHRSGFVSEVVVHVPVDLLLDPTDTDSGDADSGDVSNTDRCPGATSAAGLVPIPVLEPRGLRLSREAARFLVCDSGLHTVVEDDGGDPLHLGRRHTSITAAQRRAVHARDPHCMWPGCTATTVQLHHRHHRVAGGHDDVENLVPLCTWHHGVVHRRSILVGRSPDGKLRFVRTDGTTIGATAPFARRPAHEPDAIAQIPDTGTSTSGSRVSTRSADTAPHGGDDDGVHLSDRDADREVDTRSDDPTITDSARRDDGVHLSDRDADRARPAAGESAAPPPLLHPGTTVEALLARQRALGIDVDAPLRAPQWMNDRFDLSDVIEAIADRRDAALRRAIPTGRPPSSSTRPGPGPDTG